MTWSRLGPWVPIAVGALVVTGLVAESRSRGAAPLAVQYRPVAVPADSRETAEAARLAVDLAARRPRGVWVAVDTWRNRLVAHRDGERLRDAICSTGSGRVLKDPEGRRLWVFETPLGERRVERKTTDPVWVKPDWAFLEEGLQPPERASERLDTVSLGDFALYLGDGYLIHGTLFPSQLGQRVTHGCVRLDRADLEWLYRNLPVGGRVYFY